jgi:hypothetical protein
MEKMCTGSRANLHKKTSLFVGDMNYRNTMFPSGNNLRRKEMYIILCDNIGNTECGTDGVMFTNKLSIVKRLRQAQQYRERFRENFPNKYQRWSHCFFVRDLRYWPNNPKIYAL